MSYDQALRELKEIVDQLQNEEVGIDGLSEKIKRATELIQFCKRMLRETEEELERTFDGA